MDEEEAANCLQLGAGNVKNKLIETPGNSAQGRKGKRKNEKSGSRGEFMSGYAGEER